MVSFTESVVASTVEKLINGQDYRSEVVNTINANFLDFAVDFFKKIINAKYEDKNIDLTWYKNNFINNELIDASDVAIYAGLNKKTITNIYGKANKKLVINAANVNFDYLVNLLEELERYNNSFSINIILEYKGIKVDLSLSESLLVINALATKKLAIRGGAWSSIGKKVEKPLMKKLCELCGVYKDHINAEVFRKSQDFDREIDFKLANKDKTIWYKCEVKLMGRGNPESADAIFARSSDIFVADTLSEQNKLQAKQLKCEWLELKNNTKDEIIKNFKKILDKLEIPYKSK